MPYAIPQILKIMDSFTNKSEFLAYIFLDNLPAQIAFSTVELI